VDSDNTFVLLKLGVLS